MTPRHAPGAKFFVPLYSTLHDLWFDMQYDYVCTKRILTHRGHTPWPCPQGSHQNSECVPPVLIHRAITCDSLCWGFTAFRSFLFLFFFCHPTPLMFVCFVLVGKVPFFNDRFPLCKRLVWCFYRRFLMIALDNCRVSRPHQSLRNVEMHSIQMTYYK